MLCVCDVRSGHLDCDCSILCVIRACQVVTGGGLLWRCRQAALVVSCEYSIRLEIIVLIKWDGKKRARSLSRRAQHTPRPRHEKLVQADSIFFCFTTINSYLWNVCIPPAVAAVRSSGWHRRLSSPFSSHSGSNTTAVMWAGGHEL